MFLSYEAPDLNTFQEKMRTQLQDAKATIESLLAQPTITYESLVRPYQMIFEHINWTFTPLSLLNSTKNSEENQAVYSELLPVMSLFETEVKQDKRLYTHFKQLLENGKGLSQAQKKVLENEILDFELSGAALDEEKQARLKEINQRLSELGNRFSQNVLDATNAFEMVIEDSVDVAEIPESDRALAEEEREGKTVWKFSLQGPSFLSYMTYGSNRVYREKMYHGYTTRAEENGAVLEEILALRHEEAMLLGYDSYAELSLKTKMASDSKEVLGFLNTLADASLPQARKELEGLKAFAEQEGCATLHSYDVAYYAKKLEEKTFDLDEEVYRPYFEQKSVVRGLFVFLEKFLGIHFKRCEETTWDDKALAYELFLKGAPIAKLYMDLEARSDKRGGAWMGDWRSYCRDEKGEVLLPVAYIVCNFPPSTASQPSLLRHDDVVTLFHEMGHALHHMLSRVDEPFVSGIAGVEWDAVEFPSQFLENFAYAPEVLKLFAKHHESEEVLSDAMIEKLISAKNFQSALGMLRQLEFGLFDMKIHQRASCASEVQEILDEVRHHVTLLTPPEYNRFQHGFTHIFAGGYAAGYYSYKWAEVLSADAYYAFIDAGIFDEALAERLIDNALGRGGSRSAAENFRGFLGRDPEPQALLRLSGISV